MENKVYQMVTDRIIEQMQKGIIPWRKPWRGITSLEAITEFGFTRLSAIVKKIEDKTGRALNRADIAVGTRYGGIVRVRRYWYE